MGKLTNASMDYYLSSFTTKKKKKKFTLGGHGKISTMAIRLLNIMDQV